MHVYSQIPAIVKAAQSKNLLGAALAYAHMGFSVIPLKGKRPNLTSWTAYQQEAASIKTIQGWHQRGLIQNVGLVCGAASGNRVALDLDGAAGYPAFVATFPHLAKTYTVATGGGIGKHIYWQVETLPDPVKAMNTPLGNLEMCSQGRQIVAPPSTHPKTGMLYRVHQDSDILQVKNLQEVVDWIESFKAKQVPAKSWQPPRNVTFNSGDINPHLVQAVSQHFLRQGYRVHGDWLHGTCIHPARHKHGDRNPSFGYNSQSGYGYCFSCGTMLTKEICETVGIRPEDYGGLMVATPRNVVQMTSNIKLSDAPGDIPNTPEVIETEQAPPDDTELPPAIGDLSLPNWLQQYLNWAGATGNQTPMSFHLAAGLWLLSVAVGRRLYGNAPWGLKIYPNLYLMLIASTTYYRKSTAYKLAEQIARQAIPHMLMPTPGSPERFQEALSGKMPSNFDQLTESQKDRLKKAQPFAAQRGLLKDEVAGLFGAMNRKDYMSGMKDLLMELYDCPEYSDKDTQAGLTIVEDAALSLLGVTTPAGLSSSVSHADWSNGLLIRFALITPEADYQERSIKKENKDLPKALIEGLRTLHEKLPMPQNSEEGMQKPGAVELKVECWEQCQAYSNDLRELCNPKNENQLDERLKGVYGRMHVQAFKLASLFAVLDWIDSNAEAPTVTQVHWASGRAIADLWLNSAHRLLDQLDYNGAAQKEQTQQSRILDAFRRAGANGERLYVIYKNLHIPARDARQTAEELVRAGLLSPIQIGRSEGYVHKDYLR